MTTLVVSTDDVQEIVRRRGVNEIMDQLIRDLGDALVGFDPSAHEVPVRAGFDYSIPHPGLVEWMPMHRRGHHVTLKMVGYHPSNPVLLGLPSVLSTILRYDVSNGHLQALIDGTFLTVLRTGAASAIASRVLAPSNASTLGLIGCGAQAVSQLHALSRVLPLDTILIHDTDANSLQSFERRCAGLLPEGVRFETADIERTVTQCDVLCTATSIGVGDGPLFSGLDYPKALHVNAVGSDFPGKTELPRDLLDSAVVCPDFPEQAAREGECQQLDARDVGPDLAELVQGGNSWSQLRTRRTVFDSTGFALEDDVVAELFISLARSEGVGTEIDIESHPRDPKDPYEGLRYPHPSIVGGNIS